MKISPELMDQLRSIEDLSGVITTARALDYQSELFSELDKLLTDRGKISAKHLPQAPSGEEIFLLAEQLWEELTAHNYENLKLTTEEIARKVTEYRHRLFQEIEKEDQTQEFLDAYYRGEHYVTPWRGE